MVELQLSEGIRFHLSYGTLGYEEVLASFDTAKRVFILTYNLSEEGDLLDRIRDLPGTAAVTLITNIPGRWDMYLGSARGRAKQKIGSYLAMLDFRDLEVQPSVYFCFQNHAKVVATESCMYVGSANYTTESSNNVEAGILLVDPTTIRLILDAIWLELQGRVKPYIGRSAWTKCRSEVGVALGLLDPFVAQAAAKLHANLRQYPFASEDWPTLRLDASGLRDALDLAQGWIEAGYYDDARVKTLFKDGLRGVDLDNAIEIIDEGAFVDLLRFDHTHCVNEYIARYCHDEEQLDEVEAQARTHADDVHAALVVTEADAIQRLQQIASNLQAALHRLVLEIEEQEKAIDNA